MTQQAIKKYMLMLKHYTLAAKVIWKQWQRLSERFFCYAE